MTFSSRVNRYFSSPHLDDEKLLEQLVLKGGSLGRHSRSAHLDECDLCADRATELELFLDELIETDARSFPAFSASYTTEAGRTFAVQQNQIMDRIRNLSESSTQNRILSFPASKQLSTRLANNTGWWLSAATAAGLLLGIAVGQLLNFHPEQTMTSLEASLEPPIVASETAREQRPQTRISSTDSVIESDDTFLDDLEVILSRPQVPELSPLDEITPQIRAVSVNVW